MAARARRPPFDTAEAVRALAAADLRLGKLIARAGPFTLRLPAQQSPFEALLRSILYQQLHGKAAAAIHARLLASFTPEVAAGIPPGTGRGARQSRSVSTNTDPDSRPNGDAGLGVATISEAASGTVLGASTGAAPLFRHPSPQEILDCPNEQLRAAGLSGNKALALRDLAAKTLDGTVPTLAQIRRMADEDVIEHLTKVRGIGRWTVEMLLIFRLGRPDILPVTDYGVRKGFALTFQNLKPDTRVTPDLLPTPAVLERRARRWQPWRSVASWYLWRACDLAAGTATK